MKILGSDFDGTFNCNGITEAKLSAIEKWRSAGNKFGIVTGRNKNFLGVLLQQFPELKLDFFVSCNGGYITDADGRVIYEARCSETEPIDLMRDLF
jgi:hydroxymethylpyrimidine pyrophosphatase-like HAD family hydrolase